MVNGPGAAVRPDSVAVEFDDERLIANAGLLLTSALSGRLGLERLGDETVGLGERAGAARPGSQALSLVPAIAAGGRSDRRSEPPPRRGRRGQAGSARGALRFVQELVARMRHAGATGDILVRADSAFWNRKVMAYLAGKGCRYSIGVTMQKPVLERIGNIPEQAWQPVTDYPESGVCELAETTLGEERLIVRRVDLHAQDDQTEPFPYWRHFAFVT